MISGNVSAEFHGTILDSLNTTFSFPGACVAYGRRVLAVMVLVLGMIANAQEPFCPGGTNADDNVFYCQDFERLDACTTGTESTCWEENGFPSGAHTEFQAGRICQDGGIAGDGYLNITLPFGGVSGGYFDQVILPEGLKEVRWRFYIYFDRDYLFYNETHAPGMRIDGGCSYNGNLELGNESHYYFALIESCVSDFGADEAHKEIRPNQPAANTFRGGRWYLVEQYIKMDAHCDDPNAKFGCDGVYRMWVDGELWSEYTNLNFGGKRWGNSLTHYRFEWYYHIGFPGHLGDPPNAKIDQLVIRTDNTPIGPVAAATPQGTPNAEPYFVWAVANNFVSRQFDDCSGPDDNRRYFNWPTGWRNEEFTTIANSDPDGHNGFPPDPTACPIQAALPDQYMRIELPSSGTGSGVHFYSPTYNNGTGIPQHYQDWFLHGWIYLPSGNDYSQHPALSGFRNDQCILPECINSNISRILAFSIHEGNWAVVHRWDAIENTVVESSTRRIREDAWVEFEFWHDAISKRVSLRIDGDRVIDADISELPGGLMQPPPDTGAGSAVIGVIHFDGIDPFRAYYDDVSVGTVSFSSCDGWLDGTCPLDAASEGEVDGEGDSEHFHSADTSKNWAFDLVELLRVIQLFNSGGYHCDNISHHSEDGYAPGADPGMWSCAAHSSDYIPQNWTVSLSELLRLIQFFNSGGYHPCASGEDGYCSG